MIRPRHCYSVVRRNPPQSTGRFAVTTTFAAMASIPWPMRILKSETAVLVTEFSV
jgi:hypothetical protein